MKIHSLVLLATFLLAKSAWVHAGNPHELQAGHIDAPAITTIPFELQSRLIMVDATVNGVSGKFIFDTGAQIVVLNQNRFGPEDIQTFAMNHGAPSGAGGAMSEVKATRDLAMNLGPLQLEGLMALVTDLSHLEKNIGDYDLHGIIGYNVLEPFEMRFDYAQQKIMMLALDANGQPLEQPDYDAPVQSISFELAGHIPVFPVSIGGQELQMGLDSGASGQMIFPRHRDSLENQYEFIRTDEMKGADRNVQMGDVVRIPSMTLDDLSYPDMTFRFNDLAAHNGKPMPFDGLLGYEFLQSRPTSINLRTRQLFFWPENS